MILDIAAAPDAFAVNVNEKPHTDGRRVWVAWSNRAIRNEAGEVVGVLAVGSDITALKAAEAESARMASFPN